MKEYSMYEQDSPEKATILLVDDTSENLALMSSLLKEDYTVRIATGGEKALKIAESDSPPDLILLDIMMPDMDGYEVCLRLKKNPGTKDIPVIFLTGRSEVDNERKGLELGAVDYLTKPISPPILMARVKNHLALKIMADFLRDQNHFLELEVARRTREMLAIQEVAGKNKQLMEASRMKSEFLANMSHELRTPLNSVIGFSELLNDQMFGPINEKQQEYIRHIFNSGKHLLSMINDILDFSCLESGKLELDLSSFSLRETVEASLVMLRQKALNNMIELKFNFAEGADLCIVADHKKLIQILFNLLSNAVKYTTTGGSVDVSVVKQDEIFLKISVTDTGAGIREDDLPKLFTVFTQLGPVYTKTHEGTGLGLALTRQLIELHGGTIGVESLFGTGSKFSFTIPVIQSESVIS